VSTFYESIARHYDDIFPLTRGRLDFVLSFLGAGPTSIVDIGCATGTLACALAALDHSVIGIDIDPALIEQARSAARAQGGLATFQVGDMLRIANCVPRISQHAALCFGNTLVHLLTIERITSFFRSLRSRLARHGLFLGQIVNYDKIIDCNQTSLATIENSRIRFERRYLRSNDSPCLGFETILRVKETGQIIRNNIPLWPLRQSELTSCLEDAGFEHIEYFGTWAKQPWSSTSGATIFSAIAAATSPLPPQ